MKTTPTASITRPKGFRAAAGTCGIKASGKPDLAMIVAEQTCAAAGMFTRNKVLGAPVIVGKRHLRGGRMRAIVCNSGNSNVATGQRGIDDALTMCRTAAEAIGCEPREVIPCSTGIIGRPLPMEKITPGIETLAHQLGRGPTVDTATARAILTTDLVPKTATRTVTLGGKRVTLGGVCKGSGMIAPNLATMFAFITTDADLTPEVLKSALRQAVRASFNRVTVDTDTSTSDAVLLLASGAAGHRKVSRDAGKSYELFCDALTDLCRDLAYQLVKDGEGATKVFRVKVSGAKSERDADRVGRSVAESPLVKCAVHGADPNWGRIVMGVGKSGAAVKPDRLKVMIGGMQVFTCGTPIKLGAWPMEKLEKAMSQPEVTIAIDLGLGDAGCEWLGCDLSREYITINADYTT